jgi:hypothetical protein
VLAAKFAPIRDIFATKKNSCHHYKEDIKSHNNPKDGADTL